MTNRKMTPQQLKDLDTRVAFVFEDANPFKAFTDMKKAAVEEMRSHNNQFQRFYKIMHYGINEDEIKLEEIDDADERQRIQDAGCAIARACRDRTPLEPSAFNVSVLRRIAEYYMIERKNHATVESSQGDLTWIFFGKELEDVVGEPEEFFIMAIMFNAAINVQNFTALCVLLHRFSTKKVDEGAEPLAPLYNNKLFCFLNFSADHDVMRPFHSIATSASWCHNMAGVLVSLAMRNDRYDHMAVLMGCEELRCALSSKSFVDLTRQFHRKLSALLDELPPDHDSEYAVRLCKQLAFDAGNDPFCKSLRTLCIEIKSAENRRLEAIQKKKRHDTLSATVEDKARDIEVETVVANNEEVAECCAQLSEQEQRIAFIENQLRNISNLPNVLRPYIHAFVDSIFKEIEKHIKNEALAKTLNRLCQLVYDENEFRSICSFSGLEKFCNEQNTHFYQLTVEVQKYRNKPIDNLNLFIEILRTHYSVKTNVDELIEELEKSKTRAQEATRALSKKKKQVETAFKMAKVAKEKF